MKKKYRLIVFSCCFHWEFTCTDPDNTGIKYRSRQWGSDGWGIQ
jgi:hypothetical protein